MANDILSAIFKEQCEIFVKGFSDHSKSIFYDPDKKNKIRHPGEFGVYREKLVANFIKFFIPQRLDIDSGFIINNIDKTSDQCDIVIYDRNETPLIQSLEKQLFFPVETTVAVGEIKSNASKTQLRKAFKHLAKVKSMREDIKNAYIISSRKGLLVKQTEEGILYTVEREFQPSRIWTDQVVTFVICNKLFDTFDPDGDVNIQINDLYQAQTPLRHRVDLILSIEDGFIGYYNKDQNHFNWFCNFENNDQYPKLPLDILKKVPGSYNHLREFAYILFNLLTFITVVKPELQTYLRRNL